MTKKETKHSALFISIMFVHGRQRKLNPGMLVQRNAEVHVIPSCLPQHKSQIALRPRN